MAAGQDNPEWLRPLWRRIALVAFCAVWAGIELYNGSTGWATLVGAVGVYGAWQYLYAWKNPREDPQDATKE